MRHRVIMRQQERANYATVRVRKGVSVASYAFSTWGQILNHQGKPKNTFI